jgi:hypothetical protein
MYGLIIMGDLPRWSHCNGWPTHMEKKMKWSHYNEWPTQVEDGLIVIGDLSRWKEYEEWSHCNGWLTQIEWKVKVVSLFLIIMSDLPRCKENMKNVTYLAKWLGWRSPNRIGLENSMLPNCRVDLIIPDREGWKLGASQLHGWPEDFSWWPGWSSHFFEIFLIVLFISSSSRFKVKLWFLCYHQTQLLFFYP